MILCIVDDLIFSVKISTAARAVGAETLDEVFLKLTRPGGAAA